MNRREMIMTGAALAAVTTLARAHEEGEAGHAHHHGAGKYGELIGYLADCVSTSRDCINHCLNLFAAGDTETVHCARAAYDVQAVCGTMMVLAHSESAHLAEYGAVAAKLCRDCAKACAEHADKHDFCKRCQESCETCAKYCETLT